MHHKGYLIEGIHEQPYVDKTTGAEVAARDI